MSTTRKKVILDCTAFPFVNVFDKETDLITLETYITDYKQNNKQKVLESTLSRLCSCVPSVESLCTIKTFAEETGEIEHLTELDMMLMGIVLDIEKEANGIEHINKIPLLDRSRYFDNTDQLREVGVNVCAEPCLYFSFPGGCSRGNACFYRHIYPGDVDNRPIRRTVLSNLNPNAPSFVHKEIKLDDIKLEDVLTPVPYQFNGSHVNGGDDHLVQSTEIIDKSDSLWVGSDELASFDMNVPSTSNRQQIETVFCCTTNASIQSILIQMGFHLLSTEGKPITKLKIWTRKCSVCFRVCRDESRIFCPFCGNKSLKRVQAFINNHGIVGVGDFPFPERKPKKQNAKKKTYSCLQISNTHSLQS